MKKVPGGRVMDYKNEKQNKTPKETSTIKKKGRYRR